MPDKDYYNILGVKKESSEDEIKKSYRSLAKKYHPDKNPNDKAAEERFKNIQEAYDTLGNPEKRSGYDRMKEFEQRGFGSRRDFSFRNSDFRFDESVEMDDFFSDIFNMSKRTRNRRYGPARGNDINFELDISFENAINGCDTVIEVSREEECPTCSGTGARPGTDTQKCPICKGSGTIRRGRGGSQMCQNCNGRGTLISTPCATCNGTGHVVQTRRIPIRIPPGTENGMKIRIPGQGEVGIAGGPRGDLYIIPKVLEHRFLKRKGDDIHCAITIDFIQAIMGVTVMVLTLDGKVKLKIPSGTQPGTIFRMKGCGFGKANKTGKGDQFVKVDVSLPENITPRQRELLEQFREEEENGE